MNRDDVIKFIDGKVFYYSDYINFLYEQLQLRDEIIKEVREYIENNKQYAELEDYEKNGEYYIDEIGLLQILDKVEENK